MSMEMAKLVSNGSTIKTHQTGAVIVLRKPATIRGKYGREIPQHRVTGWSHFGQTHYSNQRSVHAEVHALARAAKYGIPVEGCTIFVACQSRAGNFTLAKPCQHCEAMLKDAGIATVVFSLDNTEKVGRVKF